MNREELERAQRRHQLEGVGLRSGAFWPPFSVSSPALRFPVRCSRQRRVRRAQASGESAANPVNTLPTTDTNHTQLLEACGTRCHLCAQAALVVGSSAPSRAARNVAGAHLTRALMG